MAATAGLDFPSAREPATRIDRLRRQLCALEAATGLAGDCGAPLTLGNPIIDGALGGGLSAAALHEIAATGPARGTRSPARGRRKPPPPAASRWRSRREGHRCGVRHRSRIYPRSAATRAHTTTKARFLSSLREETCSGSPRISRSPKMARLMGPVSTASGLLPSG